MIGAQEEARRYIGSGRGFFSVLRGGDQRSYRLGELPHVLDALPADAEAFLSQSTFTKPNRRLVNLHRLGVCFVDCDTIKTPCRSQSPEQQAQAVLLHCQENGLPRPSLINSSGRGLHVKWCFDTSVPADALPRWNAVEKELVRALEPFGADRSARDGSRCLRVVGSVNPRNKQRAYTVWQDGHRWDFDLLAREVLPIPREEVQQKRQAKQEAKASGTARPCNLWQPKQLWWNRLADVRKLIELRGWTDGVPEGSRNSFLLIATCAVAWSVQPLDLAGEVETLVQEFCPSLPLHQARSSMSSALAAAKAGKPYRFSSARIVELLDIGTDEQRKLKTLFDAEERARRHRERNRKHSDRQTFEQQAQARREQARHLRAEGLTYRQIADRMGTTADAIDRLLRRQAADSLPR